MTQCEGKSEAYHAFDSIAAVGRAIVPFVDCGCELCFNESHQD